MPKNNFLKNASTYFGANILNGLIPFLLLPVLTRFLSVESYGEVAIFQTLYMALSAFVGITMAGASDRKFFDGEASNKLGNFIGACFQICILLTALTTAIFLIYRNQASALLGVSLDYIFYAIFVSVSLVVIQIRLGQWQVRERVFAYSFMQISQSSLVVIFAVIMVAFLNFDALGRIYAQVIICGFLAAISIILLVKDNLLNFFSWNPQHIREALSFGIPLMPHIVGVFLLTMIDRFIIAGELGIGKSGIYMLAAQLATLVVLVHEAINKAFWPWLFEKLKLDQIDDKILIVKYTYIWFFVIILTAPLAFWLGPILVRIVAGPDYAEAGIVFGWLALGHSIGGMYSMLNPYIYYSKKTSILSWVTIVSGCLNVGLLLIFIKLYGMQGAAIAFALSMLVRFLLTWIAAQSKHPMPWLYFLK